MSYEDYQKGVTGSGGSSGGMDYLKGVHERERERREERESRTQVSTTPKTVENFGHRETSITPTWNDKPTPMVPETMGTMAKSGAKLFTVVFIGYTLLMSSAWTWPQMIGGGIGAVIAGALGGAALYVALRILQFALKVAVGLLAIGIVLHFLGVLNIWHVLNRLGHAIGW